MKRLLVAISFFTRIPINIKTEISSELFYQSMLLIPIIGLLIGILLYITSQLIAFIHYLPLRALLITSSYLILTGGIHYDGVADSIDGLFSSRNKQEILKIMNDPHTGTFGNIGLFMFLLSFFIVNYYILQKKIYELLIIYPVIGRYGAIELGALFSSAKPEGLGYHFCQIDRPAIFITYSILIFFPLFFFKNCYYIVSLGILIILNIFIGIYLKWKIDGITGDQLGFVIEFDQITYLVSYIILKNL